MARTVARAQGADIARLANGPTPTPYPFECGRCGGTVAGPTERYQASLECMACGRARRRLDGALRKYGVTSAELEHLTVRNAGRCAICRADPGSKGLVIDHDHATSKVRGLLCAACNWMLGNGRDDPSILRAGAAYLEGQR